ncbi:hypothetical protein GF407_07730 [candidate division KSB1 bacterium]|nr:hypothetical protein [candidate division KSB1 bacterium]
MKSNRLNLLICLLYCLVTWTACEKTFENPLAVQEDVYPHQPQQLKAQIGDRLVALSWVQSGKVPIDHFIIYRHDSLNTTFSKIDTTSDLFYTDNTVQNQIFYLYRISAVSSNGYEGPPSDIISTKAATFSISINNGEKATNNASVTLSIIAPAGTQYIRLSNDSPYGSQEWLPYNTSRAWQLSRGDGEKRVYVTFRDAEGNDSIGPIYDEIQLDTKASIAAFEVEGLTSSNKAGDTLHFTIDSGELYGEASIDIGSLASKKPLFDDGSNGDRTEEDGRYELQYIIPSQTKTHNTVLSAYFEDQLGNLAESVTLDSMLTIMKSPAPVQLFTPEKSPKSLDILSLSWTTNQDTDFLNYRIYRDTQEFVDSTATLIQIITTQTRTTAVDSFLQENSDYFYRIYVTNTQGLSSGSNIEGIHIGYYEPPTPLLLYQPLLSDNGIIALSWQQCEELNFNAYRLYRSESPQVGNEGYPVFVSQNRSQNYHQDEETESNTVYYYRLFIYNDKGLSAGSNTVSVITPEPQPPHAVQLANPGATSAGTLQISWARSRETDFDSYRLYRSVTATISTSQAPIAIINNSETTTHSDMALENDKTYYYQIYVFNRQGLSTGSNVVSGKTLP